MTTASKFAVFLAGASLLLSACSSIPPAAPGKPVNLTSGLNAVNVMHNGKTIAITRDQNNAATVIPDFAKTSRPCPPFCIQPSSLAPGVETVAEMEVIDYLSRMANGDKSLLVIDSRTPNWVEKGTIPGAVNLPWTGLNPKKGATTEGIMSILGDNFGVKLAAGADTFTVDEAIAAGDTSQVFDFTEAKTLVMFCNGMWCGQSPNNIMNLLKFGYPAEKIKWYRGGMQSWSLLGLTTI